MNALVIGSGPLAIAIADRLRAGGLTPIASLGALPPDATLAALVVDSFATSGDTAFRSVREDDLRAALDDQLYAFVAAVQAAVPRMAAGGSIVQIVSSAHLGAWGGVHLAASAAACLAMARSMALELTPLGIRVNNVAADPARGGGEAGIAATVAWLAGDDSGHINGDTIFADRGASLTMRQSARR